MVPVRLEPRAARVITSRVTPAGVSEVPRPRALVVGAGVMGAHHARVLAELPTHFSLVGVVDVRGDARESLVASFGGSAFDEADVDDALRCADHVVVATPIEAHARIAIRALEAGKSVLVEKPLAASARDASALVATAAAYAGSGARLFVGHSERFNPVVRALVRALDGEQLRAISLTRRGPASRRDARAHGVLLNLGVHDLDLVAYLCASPCDVVAVSGVRCQANGSPGSSDQADVALVTRSGVRARVRVDRLATRWTRKLTVQTESAVFEADLLGRTLTRAGRDGVPTYIALGDEEPLRAQTLAVAHALEGYASPEIATGDDGARAVHLAEEAEAQIRGVLSREVRWIA